MISVFDASPHESLGLKIRCPVILLLITEKW